MGGYGLTGQDDDGPCAAPVSVCRTGRWVSTDKKSLRRTAYHGDKMTLLCEVATGWTVEALRDEVKCRRK
jgi:hypothetical protein